MRKLRVLVGIVAFLALTAALASADLVVEYVEGFVDIKEGSDWYELFIGDSVPDDATVKLDENSVAKLRGSGVEITLTKKGNYSVQSLLTAAGVQRSSGLSSVIGGKLKSMFTQETRETQSAAMGVRGAKSEDDIEWMAGETAELLKSGKARLAEQGYNEALELFEEAYDFAEINEEAETLFYIGYTHSLMNELRDALDALNEIEPDPEADFYGNLFVLKGQLLTETFAHDEAVEWLDRYNPGELGDPATRQMVQLLKGVNYRSLGLSSAAREALQSAIDIDSNSDAAGAARNVLESL